MMTMWWLDVDDVSSFLLIIEFFNSTTTTTTTTLSDQQHTVQYSQHTVWYLGYQYYQQVWYHTAGTVNIQHTGTFVQQETDVWCNLASLSF